MRNQSIRNLTIMALFTAITPILLYGVFAIFLPDAFRHLQTKMLPLAIATQLFLATANILSYCDVKSNVNRLYNYFFNFFAISFPVTSFAINSNIPTLDGPKTLFEIDTAIFNFIIALLVAESIRVYLKYREKKFANQSFKLETEE